MKETLFVICLPLLLISCNTRPTGDNAIKHDSIGKRSVEDDTVIKDNSLQKYLLAKSNPLYDKIISIVKKNASYKKENYDESNFTVYTYLDCYLIDIQTEKEPVIRMYCPDSLFINNIETYTKRHFENYPEITIGVTKRYLEHLIFFEENQPGMSYVIDDWNKSNLVFRYNYITGDWLDKKGINIKKPHIIKLLQFDIHVIYVFKRPQEGGTIYRYEIKVKDNKYISAFKIDKVYCFGDKWGYK